MTKSFYIFYGALHFFPKYFRYVNVFYVNYGQTFQTSAPLATITIKYKRDPTR